MPFSYGLLDFALSKRCVLSMPPNPAYQYILSGPYSYLCQVTEKVLNKISIGNQPGLVPSLSTDFAAVHLHVSCYLLYSSSPDSSHYDK